MHSEAPAVGDAAFQKKCVGKMGDVDDRVRGMTDGEGRPIAVEVCPEDTSDPTTVSDQAE